jgi:benzoylformate decarboxylase
MGNIFTAFKNHTPMVITAGQQARSILPYDPFLASSHPTELPRPYVKWSIASNICTRAGAHRTAGVISV